MGLTNRRKTAKNLVDSRKNLKILHLSLYLQLGSDKLHAFV